MKHYIWTYSLNVYFISRELGFVVNEQWLTVLRIRVDSSNLFDEREIFLKEAERNKEGEIQCV